MRPRSLSVRLALSTGAFGALVLCAALVMSYTALNREIDSRTRDNLSGKLKQVAHALGEEPNPEAIPGDAHRLADLLTGHEELHLAVFRPDSNDALASFSAIARESISRFGPRIEEAAYFDWRERSGARLLSLAARAKAGNGEQLAIVLTADRRSDDELLGAFLRSALAAIPVALALIVAGAWLSVRYGLRPVQKLQQAAAAVTTRDFSHRLPEADFPRELSDLAAAFNAMLARLDDGVARLTRFSGDLAHEMRTPLSNMLGKTQVALSQPRTAEEYRGALESSIEELERLARLVSEILFLAQADNAEAALKLEPVDLRQEAMRIAEYFEASCEEAGVRMEVHGSATAVADCLMIQRALSNLVSNALRYTPAGEGIAIRIGRNPADKAASISVSNPGEPIAPAHMPHLFDRFYRIDEKRNRAYQGSGLGLAIVKSIMALHGGAVSVESDQDRGTTFRLTFPDRAASANGGPG